MTQILVVDDSAIDRRVAGGLLERCGRWSISYAEDGEAALRRVSASQPDLILTDLQMPGMDGLELVESVRRSYPTLPVILMTAKGCERTAVTALQRGAASYVAKDDLSQELVAVVDRVLALAAEKHSQQSLMQAMQAFNSEFVLENDPALLTSAVAYIQGLIADMGVLDESDRLRVGVALEEALLNAAYHGNLEVSSELRETDQSSYYAFARQRMTEMPYALRRVHLEVTVANGQVRYVVRDEGPGFNPAELPDPTDPANVDRPCGRGLLLMRTFMDDVEYNDSGNVVTMIKSLVSQAELLIAS